MNYHDSHAGFALTSVKLNVTEIVRKNNKFSTSIADEVYFNEEINFEKDKETKILSLIQTAFEELIIKNSLTSSAVSFSLPQELFITAVLPVEESLLYSDLIEHFKWQLSILYPFRNWNDFAIQHIEIDSKHQNQQAIIFALNRKYIKIISDFCERNNLKLQYIDHCHLASANTLNINSKTGIDSCLSIYISQKIISFLISSEGKPVYFEGIPISNVHETRNIIKQQFDELKQSQPIFAQAYLFGDSISDTIAKTLSEYIGIEFIMVNPFSQLNAEANVMTDKHYLETNRFFTASAGISFRL